LQACAQLPEVKEDVPPTVVEGISVDNVDAKLDVASVEPKETVVEVKPEEPTIESRSDIILVDEADDRSAKADAAFDQVRILSNSPQKN
jgi:hypothetical protein